MNYEKYAEEIKKLGITAYAGRPQEDELLYAWWQEMKRTEELDAIFSRSCYALGTFMKVFQKPTWLFYTLDQYGLKLAVWAEPFYTSAFVGLWIAPRCRKSKSTFRAMQVIYAVLFNMFQTLLGVTKQECLLTQHNRLGYTTVGCIPRLLDSRPAWLLYLSKEAFEKGRLNPERRPSTWEVEKEVQRTSTPSTQ